MNAAIALSLLVPLVLAALMMLPRARRAALAAAPWAPLPALALAFYGEDARVEAPSLLLGALFGLDQTARTFLLFTALLWTIAGVYALRHLGGDPRRARFFVFFLATCTGNLGVLLAQDIASFYMFFALMTFAAYGLVVHEGTAAARRRGGFIWPWRCSAKRRCSSDSFCCSTHLAPSIWSRRRPQPPVHRRGR